MNNVLITNTEFTNKYDIRVKKHHPLAKIPRYSDVVGYNHCIDIYSVESIILEPNTFTYINSGISIKFPKGKCAIVISYTKYIFNGIEASNSIICENYRGCIRIQLYNHSNTKFTIGLGDSIAHLLIQSIDNPNIIEY